MAGVRKIHGQLPVIRKWNCTYYIQDAKKWQKGYLVLSNHCLSFQEDLSKKIQVMMNLDSITDVKLERAWLGYKSIVVLVGSWKYWFSSFDNSQCVRRIVLHFMKEMLFENRVAGQAALCSGGGSIYRSKLGSEILSLAHDSEQTLSEAATQLATQGEQLDDALKTTSLIQTELGIGSQNISYLESWVGRWHVNIQDVVPHASRKSSAPSQQASIETKEFPIIYKSRNSVEESGTLIVSQESIIVCDQGKRTAFRFGFTDMSVISIVTPWTLVITRRMMGQPDISCHVTSAKVISILKAMESKVKDKIEYDEPENIDFISQADVVTLGKSADRDNLLSKTPTSDGGSPTAELLNQQQSRWAAGGQEQVQVSGQVSETVTESEAAELNNVLKDIKSLALGIGKELDVQDEKISHLTEDVTNLTEDARESNRRMQKLL